MAKATEEALGSLHAAVAKALSEKIKAPIYHEGSPIPNTEGLGCSSSDLQAAIAFLKNNNITADPTDNEDLRELREQLDKRRKRGKAALRSAQDAATDFESWLGNMQ